MGGTRLEVARAELSKATDANAALRNELREAQVRVHALEQRVQVLLSSRATTGPQRSETRRVVRFDSRSNDDHGADILRATRQKYALLAGAGLDPSTLAGYKAVFARFLEFCGKKGFSDPRDGLVVEALVAFLWEECERVGNTASWGQWRSAIVSYATKRLGLASLERADSDYLYDVQRACVRTVGTTTKATDPLDHDTMAKIHDKAKPSIGNGLRRRLIWLQLVVMKALTTRPGEVMDYTKPITVAGQRVANNSKVLRAKDVTFFASDARLPYGALGLRLRATKGMKLRGARGTEGERAYALGTGDAFCPVAAMREFFFHYGLADRPDEFVFASMRADGSRKFADPDEWLGAAPLKGPEFNEALQQLCADAGIPRYTARATRYGAVCDSEAWGVPSAVIDAQGRWKPGSRVSYSSFTLEGARAIHRARASALKPAMSAAAR
jgi:hypothetical protein